MRAYLLTALFLVGCGPEDDKTFTCEQSDRVGTYIFHYEERPNGTCGPHPDEVARLDNSALPPECQYDAPDTWSADQCRLDRSITCCSGNTCTSLVGFTEQRDENGARITGIASIQIQQFDPSGNVADGCTSTYDLAATRQ